MRRIVIALSIAVLWLSIGAVPASAGGGGDCHQSILGDEATNQVKMGGSCFYPSVARIGEGEKITWFNGDPVDHIVSGVGGWSSDKNTEAGGKVAYEFDDAGVYPYFCPIHPGMVGAVVVGDGGDPGGAAAITLPTEERAAGVAPSATSEGTESGVAIALVALAVAAMGVAGAWLFRRRKRSVEPPPADVFAAPEP